MAFQVSPGINISEQDLTTVVPNVATTIGAMAGGFQWGPVLERTQIGTENDLVDIFGKPNADTFTWFWTAANYLAYGNNLWVVRNVGANALNAVVGDDDAGTAVLAKNKDHYDGVTFSDQLFVAKYPGELGNSLKVQAIDSDGWADSAVNEDFIANFDGPPGTSPDVANANGSPSFVANDEMHVLVTDEGGLWTGTPGYVLEKHAFVSKASDAKKFDGSSNYVVNVMRNESKYAYVGNVLQFTTNTTGTEKAAGAVKTGGAFLTFNGASPTPGGSMTLGVDDNTMTPALLQAGFTLYQTPEVVDITLLLGGASAPATTGKWIIDNIAATRKDCMAFVSPASTSVVNNSGSEVADLTTDNTALGSSNYAVMDSAWKYQYDRYRDTFMYVPMNGDIAGLCARTDYSHDSWWSPAGLNRGTIKNIVKLSWEATKANRDTMYPLSINPIITQTGAGVVLWGDKTMQVVPSAFDRINVRRLFIVLEKAIAIAAKAMLFEFNDEFTRAQFVNMVAPFLREVQGRRGITDFKVVCDSSNNTGQIIDTNQFVGDIFIKPARSINYIQLNFIAARTDVSFSEIGG
ncbi:MAG: phage tail sheath subtilisin-like domain-containing protein [Candidatus Pacebacteria bacterium]|nr:phage tail sheath subtilisin-like domain-containing protein [Candidatus Paceibacterota bacterium]